MSRRGNDTVSGRASPSSRKGFEVIVHGVVEGGECLEASPLFARTQLFFGPDWSLKSSGAEDTVKEDGDDDLVVPTYSNNVEVVTQLSDAAKGPVPYFSWSAPFEFALDSTNPYGWPQLVVTLHTISNGKQRGQSAGKDAQLLSSGESIIAYGRCFIPMRGGYHTKEIPIMRLENATSKHALISTLTRERPVLRDLSYLCRGDDRVMLRARPLEGYVKMSFSVMINGMESCGFEM